MSDSANPTYKNPAGTKDGMRSVRKDATKWLLRSTIIAQRFSAGTAYPNITTNTPATPRAIPITRCRLITSFRISAAKRKTKMLLV